jgi:hypothetical protein
MGLGMGIGPGGTASQNESLPMMQRIVEESESSHGGQSSLHGTLAGTGAGTGTGSGLGTGTGVVMGAYRERSADRLVVRGEGSAAYRLLVVDDSVMNRKMLIRVLASRGHACEEAEDGLEAVERVTESLVVGGGRSRFDAIFMDGMMVRGTVGCLSFAVWWR